MASSAIPSRWGKGQAVKRIAFYALHYGREYLAWSVRSVQDAVDEIHVLYSDRPTFGHQTTARSNTVYIQYIPRTLSYVRTNLERYPRFDPEALPAHDLVVLPDEPYNFTAEDGPESFPGAQSVLVSGRLLTWYGPSLAEAARVLPALLQED